MNDQQDSLKTILSRATEDLNRLPPTTHNQEDIGDRFSSLTDKLIEARIEVARQLLITAENHLKMVTQECEELRVSMGHKWDEYKRLLRMMEDAGAATLEVSRRLQNGMGK
jgi:hypothetical protein